MEGKPIIYYFYTSFYSQKVLMFLNENEVEFEGCVVHLLKGETQSPWYLGINPRGEVPAMKVGDTIINGSDNILEYMEVNKLGKESLYPTDPDQLTKHDYFLDKLNPLPIDAITYGTAFFPEIRTVKKYPIRWPMTKFMKNTMLNRSAVLRQKAAENSGTPAEAVLLAKAEEHDKRTHIFTDEDEHRRMLQEVRDILDEVEKELALHQNTSWLVGERFTVADCILSIVLNRLHFLGHEDYMSQDVRPMLAAWWGRVKARKSFIKSTESPNILLYMLKTKIGLI